VKHTVIGDDFKLSFGELILQYNLLRVFMEHSFCGGQPKKGLIIS